MEQISKTGSACMWISILQPCHSSTWKSASLWKLRNNCIDSELYMEEPVVLSDKVSNMKKKQIKKWSTLWGPTSKQSLDWCVPGGIWVGTGDWLQLCLSTLTVVYSCRHLQCLYACLSKLNFKVTQILIHLIVLPTLSHNFIKLP